MRYTALRSLSAMGSGELTPQTAIHKLYWANLHRALGELAVDVLGADGMIADGVPEHGTPDARGPYELTAEQRLLLWTRADTIYGGSNQVQRNIIGERALGLPPEPKVTK
jgi:acyl-CoA dehydrogenase